VAIYFYPTTPDDRPRQREAALAAACGLAVMFMPLVADLIGWPLADAGPWGNAMRFALPIGGACVILQQTALRRYDLFALVRWATRGRAERERQARVRQEHEAEVRNAPTRFAAEVAGMTLFDAAWRAKEHLRYVQDHAALLSSLFSDASAQDVAEALGRAGEFAGFVSRNWQLGGQPDAVLGLARMRFPGFSDEIYRAALRASYNYTMRN
jgi:hypothetical protein